MIENLVYNTNRFLIGFLILLLLIITYTFKIEKYLFFAIVFFTYFELYISKIYNIFGICISILLVIIFLLINNFAYQDISYLYIYNFLALIFILICISNYRLINYFFSSLITIFLLNFFEILNYDDLLFYKLLIIAFINDTSAYLIGSYLKGPLIASKISPKKTWSGTMSSFFISSIFIFILCSNFYFTLILALSLFLGDLYFSFIKRKINKKNFSNLLKSHGGILDRFDSFFFFICIYNLILISR